ncbi:MAG: sigma-54 dependent transcriptional regulator [Dysgonamonadaceae bacterium]|jgi:DNA-binding NtrC family response regulator|nr:sigma-54 dependent transcriptional regulator [Dysgonamonadaceae bacterium]
MKVRILIADDEAKIRKIMALLLRNEGYEVLTVDNGLSAVEEVERFHPDVTLLDQRMPDMMGVEALKQIKDKYPETVVIIVTAHGSISLAVDAIKNGAYDFIEKPFDNDKLLLTIRRSLEYRRMSGELNRLKECFNETYSFGQIIGSSAQLQQVMAQVHKVAATSATVLILGESGVGKELIARSVHNFSSRSNKQFITVNCGAIPLPLVESELFGHEKGAFTDAREMRRGPFEQADGGTLFLDEIGELPLEAQVKLLRALENKTIARLGGKKSIAVDVRIIAATNCNLEEKVGEGTFRLDLFYRLNVFTIQVPPLRERRDDIPRLIDHFILKYNKILDLNVTGITQQAINRLTQYEWPGNIRDLENAVQSAMILSQGNVIDVDRLPMRIKTYPLSTEMKLLDDSEPNLINKINSAAEKNLIEETLKRYNYNRKITSEALNISRKTLFNKMKKYGIDR